LKTDVKDFWDQASCGEDIYLKGFTADDYLYHTKQRDRLEPEIVQFGEFSRFRGKRTLEIGVGLGSDHQKLAEAGANLCGIDLTPRAIGHTKRRFELFGLQSELQVADAENLPFPNESFDAVYSWGVIHHSPDTPKAIEEIYRVLKPGGFAKIMIYHKYSMVGLMLWLRYGLLKLKPFTSMETIYSKYLESPGTKAYTRAEAQILFKKFKITNIDTPVNFADLLLADVGQWHRGVALQIVKALWPRFLIRKFFSQNGIEMMIEVEK
jgi:ubiquinone/menaquinone biosynthesis C-methylase UbiE